MGQNPPLQKLFPYVTVGLPEMNAKFVEALKEIEEADDKETEEIYRKTKETEVKVIVNLDGEGKALVNTAVPFLDHMLTSLATHSLIDITASVKGGIGHHCVEDLALGLGEALNKALGIRESITRFWQFSCSHRLLTRICGR